MNAILPARHVQYLMPGPELPYIVLNKHAFEKVHVDEQAAEEELSLRCCRCRQGAAVQSAATGAANRPEPSQQRLPPAPQVAGVYTRLQLANGPAAANRTGDANWPTATPITETGL